MFQHKVLVVLSFLCHFKQEVVKIGNYAAKSTVKSKSFFLNKSMLSMKFIFLIQRISKISALAHCLKIPLKFKKAVLQIKLLLLCIVAKHINVFNSQVEDDSFTINNMFVIE